MKYETASRRGGTNLDPVSYFIISATPYGLCRMLADTPLYCYRHVKCGLSDSVVFDMRGLLLSSNFT